jgi:signal transduction histidine kinase/ActR/RegA family two-component response regulator/predicted RNA-binding protein with RPS1 domain
VSDHEFISEPRERYRKARYVEHLASGDGRFMLVAPELSARNAIVQKSDLDGYRFKDGEEVDLFLQSLTKQGSNWICRYWPIAKNPWLSGQLPSVGEEVSGEVIGFAIDKIAIVKLQVGETFIEAGLHREQLPEGQDQSIKQTLHIGDQIRALVASIDYDMLRVNLDIKHWLAETHAKARAENKERRPHPSAPIYAGPRKSPQEALLRGYKIMIIDDDSRLQAAMRRWLELLNAEVETAHDKNSTIAAAERFKPTHVLLDYSFNGTDNFEACAELFKGTTTHVAVFTGSPDRARDRAVELGLGLIPKPTTLEDLRSWLINPLPASSEQPLQPATEFNRRHWTYEAHSEQIRGQENELLSRMCERHQCKAALWLIELRPGVFDLHAWVGPLTAKDVHDSIGDLMRSVAADALINKSAIDGPLPANDPLFSLAKRFGLASPHYLVLPILLDGMNSRVIVFFKDDSFRKKNPGADPNDKTTFDRIAFRADHFKLLIRATLQADHIDQVEAFATQGRLAGAALHEARNALTGLTADFERLRTIFGLQESESLRNALGEVTSDIQRLKQILSGSLELIRADRRALTNVDKSVEGVVARMRNVAADTYRKQRPAILFEPSGSLLVTAVPPTALEQALFNLLENALGFLPNENWAQIVVAIQIDANDQHNPICVDVTDNGPGLTAEQRSRLFEPRVTAKGQLGTGLGLYVSRNLLRMAGGDLKLVESARWAGATFRISLPAVLDAMNSPASP